MARFDIYAHPVPALRKTTPFLLDVQNNHIRNLATRVVVPLRAAASFPLPVRDLNPAFDVAGKAVVADTAALAAFPAAELRTPVASLATQSAEIVAALDTLFGSY
ncbi:CcdB family protein [Ramlibacter sp.]|uniref:CcdB family protein n=1 Tax=Ramlibacter sp. TaxID=1917967 RepID=UPI0035AF4C37